MKSALVPFAAGIVRQLLSWRTPWSRTALCSGLWIKLLNPLLELAGGFSQSPRSNSSAMQALHLTACWGAVGSQEREEHCPIGFTVKRRHLVGSNSNLGLLLAQHVENMRYLRKAERDFYVPVPVANTADR